MSTCPEKDIHSIYIDNELPAAYVAEYEAHVKSCPRCQAELNRLRSLRQTFSADSKNATLSQDALEAGFNRLQARLSYAKVTGQKQISPFIALKDSTTFHSIVGAAVAAAIIAVVLPIRANTSSDSTAEQFQPVARAKIESPAKADVRVDGAINTATLSSLLGNPSSNSTDAMQQMVAANSPMLASPVTMYGVPVSTDASQTESLRSTLTSYDVFCPVLEQDTVLAAPQKKQSVSIQFDSALGHFSLKIGNEK